VGWQFSGGFQEEVIELFWARKDHKHGINRDGWLAGELDMLWKYLFRVSDRLNSAVDTLGRRVTKLENQGAARKREKFEDTLERHAVLLERLVDILSEEDGAKKTKNK